MNRAVFLDRDGVINAAIYNPVERKLDSPYTVESFRILPHVPEAIRLVNRMGFLAVVVSNQPGVAKGKCDFHFLDRLNETMQAQVATGGGHLDAIYYCYHHPAAVVEELRLRCQCRKPQPGLVELAAEELDFAPQDSLIIGDKVSDIELGQSFGATTFLVRTGYGARVAEERAIAPARESVGPRLLRIGPSDRQVVGRGESIVDDRAVADGRANQVVASPLQRLTQHRERGSLNNLHRLRLTFSA